MIEIVRTYEVKTDGRGQFELSYGPGGAWSKLFADCQGFLGITVLRDTVDPQRYLTIEVWNSGAQRAQALAERQAAYAELSATFGEWIESTHEMGVYSVLAEAGVRRRGGAGRSKPRMDRRRG